MLVTQGSWNLGLLILSLNLTLSRTFRSCAIWYWECCCDYLGLRIGDSFSSSVPNVSVEPSLACLGPFYSILLLRVILMALLKIFLLDL